MVRKGIKKNRQNVGFKMNWVEREGSAVKSTGYSLFQKIQVLFTAPKWQLTTVPEESHVF